MTNMPAGYDTLVNDCAWKDASDRTRIELVGADCSTFLHNFCTADIKSLTPGDCCEAFITSVKGKTLGHVLVFASEAGLAFDSEPNQATTLVDHLDRYVIREDVRFILPDDDWAQLLVAGPNASQRVEELTQNATAYTHAVPWLKMPAYLIGGSASAIGPIKELLSSRNVCECSDEAVEAVRMEAVWPRFGIDITDDNLPQEIDRTEQAISFTKGCYLGQETVARIDAMGHVNRMLVAATVSSDEIPAIGSALSVEDKKVGKVTSACYSPAHKSPLVLGFVTTQHHAIGTPLTTSVGPATVVGRVATT